MTVILIYALSVSACLWNIFVFSVLFQFSLHMCFSYCAKGGPWLSGRVLASGPVGPGIDTPPGHG